MKVVIRVLVMSAFLVGLLMLTNKNLLAAGDRGDMQHKAIAVVLDNSTSMVRDDPGGSEELYTTRWCEADYAVRALAAMMEDGDILRLFPLNEDQGVEITIGKDDMGQLYSNLDNMNYYGKTPFKTIETAIDYLKSQTAKECILIVITDGNFKSGGGESSDLTQAELDGNFGKLLNPNPNINVKYIPIGPSNGRKLPNHKQVEICNNSEDIIQQITGVINGIYNRVQMEEKLSEEKIDFNIPVKNVKVFLQSEEELIYTPEDAKVNTADYNLSTSMPFFSVTSKEPGDHWKSKERYNENWVKRESLNGLVFNYNAIHSLGSEESILIPGGDNKAIQVYYEPAIEQRITIQQNNDAPYIYDANSKNHFVEGDIKLTVEYMDLEGNLLQNQGASMLKGNEVKIQINGRNLKDVKLEPSTGGYTYYGTLEETDSDSSIIITNKIGLYGGEKEIPLGKVGEPNVELSVGLVNQTLTLDKEGKANLKIQVLDNNKGDIFSEGRWEGFGTPTCESEYFEAEIENCVYHANGIVEIPVKLKEPFQHQIKAQESFDISFSRNYKDERSSVTTGKVSLCVNVTSVEHNLEVRIEETSLNILRIIICGGEIPITYSCDGQKLSEEQKRDVRADIESQETQLAKSIFFSNGNIHFSKGNIKLFFENEEDYFVNMTVSYTKWNKEIECELLEPMRIITLTQKEKTILVVCIIFSGIALFLFMLWFLVLSPKRKDYIDGKTIFKLKALNGNEDTISSITLSRTIGERIKFRAKFGRKPRCTHVRYYFREKEKAMAIPNISLYIAKLDNGNWKLRKIDKTEPNCNSGCLLVGNEPVDSTNSVFTLGENSEHGLTIKNRDKTITWQLNILKNTK